MITAAKDTYKGTRPSDALDKLQRARDKAHQPVLDIRRERDAHDAATERMRGELSGLLQNFPGQFEGGDKRAKDGTDAAKLTAEIRKRQTEPNPHQAEYEEARAKFWEVDEELQRFQRQNVRARIEEVQDDARRAVLELRSAHEALRTGCERYRAAIEEVRAIVCDTPGMDGQDYGFDLRVNAWYEAATRALDSEISLPQLTQLGEWKADRG